MIGYLCKKFSRSSWNNCNSRNTNHYNNYRCNYQQQLKFPSPLLSHGAQPQFPCYFSPRDLCGVEQCEPNAKNCKNVSFSREPAHCGREDRLTNDDYLNSKDDANDEKSGCGRNKTFKRLQHEGQCFTREEGTVSRNNRRSSSYYEDSKSVFNTNYQDSASIESSPTCPDCKFAHCKHCRCRMCRQVRIFQYSSTVCKFGAPANLNNRVPVPRIVKSGSRIFNSKGKSDRPPWKKYLKADPPQFFHSLGFYEAEIQYQKRLLRDPTLGEKKPHAHSKGKERASDPSTSDKKVQQLPDPEPNAKPKTSNPKSLSKVSKSRKTVDQTLDEDDESGSESGSYSETTMSISTKKSRARSKGQKPEPDPNPSDKLKNPQKLKTAATLAKSKVPKHDPPGPPTLKKEALPPPPVKLRQYVEGKRMKRPKSITKPPYIHSPYTTSASEGTDNLFLRPQKNPVLHKEANKIPPKGPPPPAKGQPVPPKGADQTQINPKVVPNIEAKAPPKIPLPTETESSSYDSSSFVSSSTFTKTDIEEIRKSKNE